MKLKTLTSFIFIISFLLITLFSCLNINASGDSELGSISPPEWIHGTWEDVSPTNSNNDNIVSYGFRFTEDDFLLGPNPYSSIKTEENTIKDEKGEDLSEGSRRYIVKSTVPIGTTSWAFIQYSTNTGQITLTISYDSLTSTTTTVLYKH